MQPKKRTSKARRDRRRSHLGLGRPHVNFCPQCGSPRGSHSACGNCGYVNPRVKLPVKEES